MTWIARISTDTKSVRIRVIRAIRVPIVNFSASILPNRLHQPFVVLRAPKSGFKLIGGHELLNPGDDADKYYNRGSLNTGWLKKLSHINLLTLEIILDINEQIKIRALKDHRIEYSGSGDYQIKMYELKKLIEYAPKNRDILDVAVYYLKNIILLQAFPDANHRTALAAIEMFLEDNNLNFDYTTVEAFDFRKELYNCRLMVYKTYEEMSTRVLKEDDNHAGNSVFALCLKFVKAAQS